MTLVLGILNALVAIPKIAGYVEQIAAWITSWYVQRCNAQTQAAIKMPSPYSQEPQPMMNAPGRCGAFGCRFSPSHRCLVLAEVITPPPLAIEELCILNGSGAGNCVYSNGPNQFKVPSQMEDYVCRAPNVEQSYDSWCHAVAEKDSDRYVAPVLQSIYEEARDGTYGRPEVSRLQ